jgi:DNA-directed RNA polymerase subunit RPC12/RpoP
MVKSMPNDKRMRECLKCGKEFMSKGWGYRRCPKCRSRVVIEKPIYRVHEHPDHESSEG